MIGLQTTSDIVCRECSTELDSSRVQLGLFTCIECSDTQKYSAHIVYPHKTGSTVQPVKEDTKKNLQRLDRRSANGNRIAKGIFADNSWDRWLERYYNNIYSKQPAKKISLIEGKKISHMENNKLQELILKNFIELGYDQSVQKVNELYSQDKISLIQKTKAVSKLTKFGMLNRKDKKLLTKQLKDI